MSSAKQARIEATIRLLVKDLSLYSEVFTFNDFRSACIRVGVGVDPRTAEVWLGACLALYVLKVSEKSTPKLKLYERGPDFDKYLDEDDGGGS